MHGKNFNELEKFFFEEEHIPICKWVHYFDIYDRHFSKFRGKEITIVEIGVFQGGSLQMWKNYFGPKARIIGIDINSDCKKFEDDQIEIYIGSQEDKNFWRDFKTKVPQVDILLDDGGHTMRQQIITFEEMFEHISNEGIYLCEDCHTSYWSAYGGGYKRKNTFIEYSKNFIDNMNAWYSNSKKLQVSESTKSMRGLHYYDSVIVIEKKIQGDVPTAIII